MIAVFLSPYAFRGAPAPYLWVFYKFLSNIEESICFMLSADYLASPGSPVWDGRSEFDADRMATLGYSSPDVEVLARHRFALMDSGLMQRLLPRYGGNPLAFFKAFLSQEIPEVMDALRACLVSLPPDIDVIVTWSNCPSLAAVAKECGIRVVYMEVGPLRGPQYRSTGYFDFTGVNGNTEAAARNDQPNNFPDIPATVDDLRLAFSLQPVVRQVSGNRLGVVLQVEDDSNLLCFNNGYDNIGLISHALLDEREENLLIRTHPGSRFDLKPGRADRDTSPSVAGFLGACRKVISINSSVGLEALLFDVPVAVLGDTSYRFVALEPDPVARVRKLCFYLFAYLVPFELIFSADYIRFRLGEPSELDIVVRHLQEYGTETTYDLQHFENYPGSILDALAQCSGKEARPASSSVPSVFPERTDESTFLKLYYRQAQEDFREEFSRQAVADKVDSFGWRVRFRLPAGQKPDYVRFDLDSAQGIYELTEMRWGWKDIAEDSPLFPLFDLADRVISVEGERVDLGDSIKLLSQSGRTFFELSVGDLWRSMHAEGEGSGVIELGFVHRTLQAETVVELLRQGQRLARVESGSTSASCRLLESLEVLGRINAGNDLQARHLERLEGAVAELSKILSEEGEAIVTMERDLSSLIAFLRDRPTLWARITGRTK